MTGGPVPSPPGVPDASPGPPRVSVVVPTCNRAHVLPRALASVVRQDLVDLEVIVVDDGSTDATPAVADAFPDPRIVWITAPHGGVVAARNRALAVARGEWVAFLDDDNEWLPTHLSGLVDAAERSGADAVSGLAVEVGPDGSRLPQAPPPAADLLVAEARFGWAPFASCVLARRSLVARVGGFVERTPRCEDRHLWIRVALAGRWDFVPATTMVRHADAGVRLTDDDEAIRRVHVEIEREFRRPVRRRVGRRAATVWYRRVWRNGDCRDLIARVRREGRGVAWRLVGDLARGLPASAPLLGRPLAVGLLGVDRYERGRVYYHGFHVRARTVRR